jgi:hypothetical protein
VPGGPQPPSALVHRGGSTHWQHSTVPAAAAAGGLQGASWHGHKVQAGDLACR